MTTELAVVEPPVKAERVLLSKLFLPDMSTLPSNPMERIEEIVKRCLPYQLADGVLIRSLATFVAKTRKEKKMELVWPTSPELYTANFNENILASEAVVRATGALARNKQFVRPKRSHYVPAGLGHLLLHCSDPASQLGTPWIVAPEVWVNPKTSAEYVYYAGDMSIWDFNGGDSNLTLVKRSLIGLRPLSELWPPGTTFLFKRIDPRS